MLVEVALIKLCKPALAIFCSSFWQALQYPPKVLWEEGQMAVQTATQKRVLVEVALIKLCKPQMETVYDALVDRVGKLEEAVEHGSLLIRWKPQLLFLFPPL